VSFIALRMITQSNEIQTAKEIENKGTSIGESLSSTLEREKSDSSVLFSETKNRIMEIAQTTGVDANLYNRNGELIASTQSGIFNNQLLMPLANRDAWEKIVDENYGTLKVQEKIVADGIADPGFDMNKKRKYVTAAQMNQLMKEPYTIVIDMRNHYEYEVGHFENALEIPSDTFREQLPMAVDMMKEKKDKNIIMYCTGGIRCEKASAFMLHNGFNNVFHLEGGIINYAREIRSEGLESKFIGKNFVFDERLGERITEDIISHCHQCGKPADIHVNCANSGCHLLFIQCDECKEKFEGCCSKECRDIIHMPEEEQMKIRRGIDKGRNIFNKSKARLRPKLNNPGA